MQMTLADGTVLTGTAAEMREYLVTVTPTQVDEPTCSSNGFSDDEYKSESRGWTRIGDMNTLHIRNAILKIRRERETNTRWLEFEALVNELSDRAYAGMRGEIRE